MSNLAEHFDDDSHLRKPILDTAHYLLGRMTTNAEKCRKLLDDEATKTSAVVKLSYLKKNLGRLLTAHIINIHPKTLDKYQKEGTSPEGELTKILLRESFKITKSIVEKYDAETARAWLQGTNFLLNEESPADVLHTATSAAECKLVFIAALAFTEE